MNCSDKFRKLVHAPGEETRVEPAEVDGRPTCDHPGCGKRLLGSMRCVDGHVQGQAQRLGAAQHKAAGYEVAIVKLLATPRDAEQLAADATDATALVDYRAYVGTYVRPADPDELNEASAMVGEDLRDRSFQMVEVAMLVPRGGTAAISEDLVWQTNDLSYVAHMGVASRRATATDVISAEDALGEPLEADASLAPEIQPTEALEALQCLTREWVKEGTLPMPIDGERFAPEYVVRNAAALYEELVDAGLPLTDDPRWQVAQAFIHQQVLPPQLFTRVGGDLPVHYCYKKGDALGWLYQVRDPQVAGDDPLEGWLIFDIRDLMRARNDMPANENFPNRERHRQILEREQAAGTLREWLAANSRRGRLMRQDAPLRADPPIATGKPALQQWVGAHGDEVGDWPEGEIETFAYLQSGREALFVMHAYDEDGRGMKHYYTMLDAADYDRTFDIRDLARDYPPEGDWDEDDEDCHRRLLEHVTHMEARPLGDAA